MAIGGSKVSNHCNLTFEKRIFLFGSDRTLTRWAHKNEFSFYIQLKI